MRAMKHKRRGGEKDGFRRRCDGGEKSSSSELERMDLRQKTPLRFRAMNAARFLRALAGLWLWLGLSTALPAADTFTSIYISEVFADDARGVKDEEGNRTAWIELHNAGTWPVSLGGWFLTDNATNPAAWRFPNVVLLPDKSLLIYASGKNRTNDLLHLHAGFSLNLAGGFLGLVTPTSNLVSELNYPKFSGGASFGSVRGEPALRGLFLKPTPGKANAISGTGFAPEVFFSRPSGTFTQEFALELFCPVPNAVIRYTRDGTLPTSNSPVYATPLLITNTAHLRARAYQDGLLPGPPASVAFLELYTNVLSFSSPLPVLVLDTFGKHLPTSDNEAFTHVSLFEPANGRTWLTNAPSLTARAGFRQRGSSSAGLPQPSFALQFLDEFNDEKDHALLGLPADSDWVLYAPNVYDPVLIHNPFVHQLSRDLGRYSPRTRFVEVFLSRSAGRVRDIHYHGLYVLQEKIKIAPQRVSIDKLSATDVKASKVTGGYLLKFDRLGPNELGLGMDTGGFPLVYVEPKEPTMDLPQRAAQRKYIRGYMREFQSVLASDDWKNPATGYRSYLDLDAAVDFHLLEVLSGNVDAMVLSTYFYKPRGGKIICGPHWDFDRALGSTDGRDENPRHWNTGPYFSGTWWPRVCSDPDFWQQWADRWQELRGTHFSITNLHGLMDRLADEVREVQPRTYQRWGLVARGGSYQSEVNHMKNWLSNRVDFIDRQFTPAPVLSHAGGLVTLSAPTNATIYYTLDGTDPRLSQGGISSSALIYTNAISLKTGAQVIARARNPNQRQTEGPPVSTPWSGRVEAGLK
jgi:hypothetical protein